MHLLSNSISNEDCNLIKFLIKFYPYYSRILLLSCLLYTIYGLGLVSTAPGQGLGLLNPAPGLVSTAPGGAKLNQGSGRRHKRSGGVSWILKTDIYMKMTLDFATNTDFLISIS